MKNKNEEVNMYSVMYSKYKKLYTISLCRVSQLYLFANCIFVFLSVYDPNPDASNGLLLQFRLHPCI